MKVRRVGYLQFSPFTGIFPGRYSQKGIDERLADELWCKLGEIVEYGAGLVFRDMGNVAR